MIELRTHEDLPTGAARTEWELLLDEDPAATVFQGPRFLSTWHRVLGQRTTPRIHTVHGPDGRLLGVVPESHVREGSPTGPVEVRRFLGGAEVTDYLGPVARPEDRADVAEAYVAHLARDRDWDDAVLGGLAIDSGWGDALARAASQHGLTVFERDIEDVCPRVDLTGGYDGYLGRLKGKLRHELTRKARKLARDAGELEVVAVPPGEVAGELEAFLDLARESEPEKAGFFTKAELQGWFRALADEFAADGTFRLHRLQVGGMPGAMTVSLVHDGQWGVYNSAFDPALAALGPGMVLKGQLIELAANEGCRVYDLLRGDEAYKYQFGAVDRAVERLTLVRS
ncbi:GNAT family N-acetyltransferase [Nitriliruptor alkaliphilus]|uniref:GNAT family N-acetyltransferase n=1 Tax=Nitriliruptor alkaliphilus TaxID=427918 RepID=UPI000697E855|nr:GNAT family N-acetyltransferase [Nitriliruptor alkaliphilus]